MALLDEHCDLVAAVPDRVRELGQSVAAPFLRDARGAVEDRLGAALPDLLVDLYVQIGNGGFGPPYGLLGLEGGHRDHQGRDALALYDLLREEDDGTHMLPGDVLEAPLIRAGSLPILHLGCGMYVLIDCREDAALWLFDPARDDAPVSTLGYGLAEWMAAWAAGTTDALGLIPRPSA